MKPLSPKSLWLLIFSFIFLSLPAQEWKDVSSQSTDSLSERTAALEKAVGVLQKIKVTGYIQGQYQYGQQDADLRVGSENENPDKGFNRIGIRRGRIKFTYTEGIGTGVINLDATEKGVSIRDLYIALRDPWTKQNELRMGVFDTPFGYEVDYSTGLMESPERATVVERTFPAGRDLGAMIKLRPKSTSPLHFLRWDMSIHSGNGINVDADSRKDISSRLIATQSLPQGGFWEAGVSYYYGHVYNPTQIVYHMEGDRFLPVDKAKTGTYMKREYFGANAQIRFVTGIGATTFRLEGLFGTQPGTLGSSKSPDYSKRPDNVPANELFKRPFSGYILYLLQDIGTSRFSALLKYDSYDPNTKLKGKDIGGSGTYTSATDLRQSTLGIGLMYQYDSHLRILGWYDFNYNEEAPLLTGYNQNRKDNVFTARVQYRF